MYAETGLMFPYFQNFCPETHQLEEFYYSQKPNASMENLGQTSAISEYNFEEEGDLFKAPEPIIEDLVFGIDPMTTSLSMSSCGDNVLSLESLSIADIESIQNEQFFNEMFCECKKDLLENEAIEAPFSEVLDSKIPVVPEDETMTTEEKVLPEDSLQKSVSSGCLSSMERLHGTLIRPNFLDFPGVDFETIYGMRRAFSEGDMKTLCNSNVSCIHSPLGHPQIISTYVNEDRMRKLSRYRNKKTKRNFGRRIKYACRKALADSQPRIRGRFAKTDDSDICKKQ